MGRIALIILFFAINYSGSRIQPNFEQVWYKVVYWGLGVCLDTSSFLAQWGWKISHIVPTTSTTRNELMLFSELLKQATNHIFEHTKKSQRENNSNTISRSSWQRNRELLSMIAASSKDWELIYFLQERWLAKMAGLYPFAVDWIYPCFEKYVQINPNTNHAYARLLTSNFSNAYVRRREYWKKSLCKNYPLLLTRPADIREYLPPTVAYLPNETLPSFVNRIANKLKDVKEMVVIDVSSFPFALKDLKLNSHSRLICVQRLNQETIGGLQVLPLPGQSFKNLKQNHQFLLDWISCFGLAANRVELDRWPLCALEKKWIPFLLPISPIFPSLCRADDFLKKKPWWQNGDLLNSDLSVFASLALEANHKNKMFYEHDLIEYKNNLDALMQQWQNSPLDQSILIKGTFQLLKGLFHVLNNDLWEKLTPSKEAIVQLSLQKILLQWDFLTQIKETLSFFELATHLEQIHSDLSVLLEIFSPFLREQFQPIYLHCLSIPPLLKSFTSCGVHSSAMTSLAGIIRSVEKMVARRPHILYGENTYFECINAAKKIGHAFPLEKATNSDLEQVDLLLAQFNPVLKLGVHSGYIVENIAPILHKILKAKKGVPLTLALDCTIDFLDSPRVAQLLQEFQKELGEGMLTIVAYRSGNKFDLFGMDNYSGAPFFMIHNQDPKWHFFDALLEDAALQADRLSLQWFCLAYQYAAPQLELYRKKIFENTRSVLHKLPKRLSDQIANYRVPSFEEAAQAAFIDIQVIGLFHKMRAAALVAGTLWLKSIEQGTIIFDRPSLGFYHPNLTMIFGKDSSTIRLTLGLDPKQIDIFVDCLTNIDRLNGI